MPTPIHPCQSILWSAACVLLTVVCTLTGGAHIAAQPLDPPILDWRRGQKPAMFNLTPQAELVDGSIVGRVVEPDNKWNIFFTTDADLLDGGERYRVIVDYRVLDAGAADNAMLYMVMRSDEPGAQWTPTVKLDGEVGEPASVTVDYLLPDGVSGHELRFCARADGALAIDRLRIQPLPRLDAAVLADPDLSLTAPGPADFEGRPFEPFALCAHLDRVHFYTDEQVEAALDFAEELGVQTFRVGVSWTRMMPHGPDAHQPYLDRLDRIFTGLERRGIEPLLVIIGVPSWASSAPPGAERPWSYMPRDLDQFRDYVRLVVDRYGGFADFYEINNEPDWHFWSSSIADYMTYSRAAVEIIRELDPQARVMNGGFSGTGLWYMEGSKPDTFARILDLGFAEVFDILAIHTYDRTAEQVIYRVNRWQAMLESKGLGDTPIWITEAGFSVWHNEWNNVTTTEAQQADYLSDLYNIVTRHPSVEKVFWYNLRNKDHYKRPRERGFGLIQNDFTTKPAADVYRRMTHELKPGRDPRLWQVDRWLDIPPQ